MARIAASALGIAIAVVVPAVLAINGIRLITNDEYVRVLYDHGGVPSDHYGFSGEERTRLALLGLHSIQPSSDRGIEPLRTARLRDGTPAFGARELAHMQDVRSLLGRAYRFQVMAAIVIAALAVLLGLRRSTRAIVPVALARGAVLTVLLAVGVAVMSLVDWGSFSTPFHTILFAGDSWRFADTDTLRRLYPDRFWLDTAVVVGLVAVLQAALLFLLGRAWSARARAGQASHLRPRTQGT